ncbi:MAG: xanthine dehydrogenase small subunit [Gammaproteobacteria bacterium]|nr:xanthine dehydrogenase small subunit [Gammaproteobacteria bacterium]
MGATGDTNCRRTLRFVLDGEVIELAGVDPSRTVLEFLREDLGRTGTKEGCAEGDCGACTVVVAEARDGRLCARPVNACIQFLPALDGRELVTVESLGAAASHPVQRAMIASHGSQCGFCTPGFVMSLFALYKTARNPARRQIDDALAGNLCRCTGYRPIIDAAAGMYDLAPQEGGWLEQPAGADACPDELERLARLEALSTGETLCVERQGRRFLLPTTLGELAALAAEHPDATLLAGGTDVGLTVTKALCEPETLICVGRVPELLDCRVGADRLEIGAAVPLADAAPFIVEHYPELDDLFTRFASPPIRSVATLGGNIANGSPIGDSMPALIAIGADLVLRRTDTTRTLPLEAFFRSYRRTALEPGEFIERVLVPLPRRNEQVRSYKVSKRFDQDISAVCGAYRLQLENGKVAEIAIAYGGMAEIPKRAEACETAIAGRAWSAETIEAGMAALDTDYVPIGDMRASASYRAAVCRNLLRRFFLETTGAASETVYGYGR